MAIEIFILVVYLISACGYYVWFEYSELAAFLPILAPVAGYLTVFALIDKSERIHFRKFPRKEATVGFLLPLGYILPAMIASQFRKMVTLEQYRSQMMADLYKRYLIDGPIEYMTQLFCRMLGDDEAARQFAYAFYSPIYMLYSEYDHAADKQKVIKSLENMWCILLSILNALKIISDKFAVFYSECGVFLIGHIVKI
ncbi:MAG: hypothetical protein PUD20_09740 [bacterium]|nr:hypothetical protein [bacterium]